MSIEETHLGKQSSYPKHYAPEILVAVPRILNRRQYNISNDNLPFVGFDVWHAYEFSLLTNKGLPIAGVLKIVYISNNEFLVESKSLKLYLNSFNMDKYGNGKTDGIEKVKSIIKTDLENLLKCDVDISFLDHSLAAVNSDFSDFSIIEDEIDETTIECKKFEETPQLLQKSGIGSQLKWGTHLLRSNCKITHQPDWGSLFISLKGSELPTRESFIKYIVSLRNENHFHEEICEMVFQRILDIFKPEKLMVCCLYTRRGGIDINPIRSLDKDDIPLILSNYTLKDTPIFRQ